MPRLNVEGDRSIYYEHHRGAGRPVVLVHAWGMTGRLWDRVTPELIEDGHAVVVMDHRGCGQSDKDFDDNSIAAIGGDVVALVDELGLDRPVLNGWSAGGAIVTEAAGRLGDRLGGLVLTVGASPLWAEKPDFPQGNPRQAADDTLLGLRTARADTAWAVSGAICHAPISEITQHWMYEMFMENSPRADETLADLKDVDLRELLPTITAPALVFGGRHDVFVPFAIAEAAAEMLPAGRLVACEGSGHAPPLEEPELYLGELRAFLKAL
ncbi:MAG: alpha/beta hydrolase fold protein [Solirubrobacterales bacterium]|jgi:non-heme chloroperoxidase|nr:alpha/beta hydrolase fold protein [Solirubrobacterales bacterium]